MQRKFWFILLAAGIIIIIVGIIFFFDKYSISSKNTVSGKPQTPVAKVSPIPIPFYDLTVPYLRSRTYVSELGMLEKVSATQTYTSYLTSYTSDGLKINGLITEPIGTMPRDGWPAIVFDHGYIPPDQYQTLGAAYSTYVDYLAKNGFVVFKPDFRGHGTSPRDFGGGSYYSSNYVIDTLNAYVALQSSNFVNPKKIGLWGHSMSGNIVMRSFAVKPDIPAVVIWAGAGYTYTDLSEHKVTDASYQPQPASSAQQIKRQEMSKLYGDPKDGNPFWKLVAPSSYLNDLKGAIQIHHAIDDDTVNIAYSRNLNALLNKTSVVHELYEYPTGGHNISDPSFSLAMQRTVIFFKKYLQ